MARNADRDGSAGGSGILKRFDPFVWLPVVPLLLLAVWALIIQVPLLALVLAVAGFMLLGFDFWVNSRRKGRSGARRRRDDDYDELDSPRRAPARRPQQRPVPERVAAPRTSNGQRTRNGQRVGHPQRGATPPRRTRR